MAAFKKRKTVNTTEDFRTVKEPKVSSSVSVSKTPRWIGPTNIENTHLAWRFSKADLNGPYHCGALSHEDFRQLWDRLRSFEGKNAEELHANGSLHEVSIENISREAKQRISELKYDDIDSIHSFRIDGKCRLWCMKYQNIFCILWWDKDHEVYPVEKRHT